VQDNLHDTPAAQPASDKVASFMHRLHSKPRAENRSDDENGLMYTFHRNSIKAVEVPIFAA
jgi:hypothetical protein